MHKFAKYRDFYPGQLVYYYAAEKDQFHKIVKGHNYIGPMRVLHKINKVNYIIIDTKDVKAKEVKTNAHRLIPYTSRKPELNYFTNNSSEYTSEYSVPSDDCTIQKPHVKFDTQDDLSFIFSHPNQRSSTVRQNHTTADTSAEENISMCTTKSENYTSLQDTEIYDPRFSPSQLSQQTLPPQATDNPTLDKRTPYSLRQSRNVNYYAERVYDTL